MTSLASRREFLGTAAGSAVALASGPLLAQAAALPSQKVTIGIMGLNRGMQVAAALELQPGVVIKYVCDVDSKRAEEAKAQLERGGNQRPQAITDFRRILDDQEVDALFCEAPNHWHGPATILACDAGKHVYVEKPCSHNPWEGEQMMAAARKHKRAVQMGAQRRSTLLCHLGNIAYRTQQMLRCNPENGHILDDEAAMAFWQREYEPSLRHRWAG